MKRNKIIVFALIVSKALLFFMGLIIIVLLLTAIHWHINKEFYTNIYLTNGFQAGLDSFNLKISKSELSNISLADLSHLSLYWILLRSLVIMIISMYILTRYIHVLNSIKSLQTFYNNNVKAFRQVATMSIILALISFFNFGPIEDNTTWNYTIPFGLIFFTAFNLALSEVFKEGQGLLQDSQAII